MSSWVEHLVAIALTAAALGTVLGQFVRNLRGDSPRSPCSGCPSTRLQKQTPQLIAPSSLVRRRTSDQNSTLS